DSGNLAAVAVEIDADCSATRKDDLGDVRQVVFALIIRRFDFAQCSVQFFCVKTVDAGVDLFDETLIFSGVSLLDDLLKRVILIANDAPVASRVFETNTQNRAGCSSTVVMFD